MNVKSVLKFITYGSLISLTLAFPYDATKTSSDDLPIAEYGGECGAGIAKCPPGECCSQFGHCGEGAKHCGVGCQSEFGKCGDNDNTDVNDDDITDLPVASIGGRCGRDIAVCPSGQCCSSVGYCGITSSHCGVGCQSQFGKCGNGDIVHYDDDDDTDNTEYPTDYTTEYPTDYPTDIPTDYDDDDADVTDAADDDNSDLPIADNGGECGAGVAKCPSGQCCSQFGHCGISDDHCGAGCQSEFGECH